MKKPKKGMKRPEYIGYGKFDENNYVYAYCKCPLPMDYAIKWPLIKDGKPHRYSCICENCGTEVAVFTEGYIKEESEAEITETSMHHLACAMCDNEKCVRGTKECEFEKWKEKQEREGE